eukprot:537020-Pleurochrysis_carterae.AAC.3
MSYLALIVFSTARIEVGILPIIARYHTSACLTSQSTMKNYSKVRCRKAAGFRPTTDRRPKKQASLLPDTWLHAYAPPEISVLCRLRMLPNH